jgi:hypothetical protein
VLCEQVFHLQNVHFQAAHFDQQFQSAGDREVAVFIEMAQVAGVEITLPGFVEITTEHRSRADQHFPFDDLDLDAVKG